MKTIALASLIVISVASAQTSRDISSLLGEQHRLGIFYGVLQFENLSDGVHKKLLSAYSYVDAAGHALSAQPGFVTDGASVPRFLWSFVGSPFTGKYVGAAVIHDVGCDTHKYSWQITHRMFYDAMLDSGVNEHQAKVMYYGVRYGGPKWKTVVVQAKSNAELAEKIRQSGAISVTETSGTARPEQPKTATLVVPIKSKQLTLEQLRAFDKELTAKETSGGTITPSEIDDRTIDSVLQPQ
jgi:hypothetical protein